MLSSSELDSSDSSGFVDFLVVSGELDLLDALLELSGVGSLADFLAAMAGVDPSIRAGWVKKKNAEVVEISPG